MTIVTVLAGEERKPFYVYKEVLCYYSRYFQNAVEGSFREAGDRELVLDDTDVQTFRHVAQWLQDRGNSAGSVATTISNPFPTATTAMGPGFGNVKRPDKGATGDEGSNFQPSFASASILSNLYIFADRYDIRQLRNDVVDAWRCEELMLSIYGGLGLQNDVFLRTIQSTPSQSTLHRYLLKRQATSFNWHTASAKNWLQPIWDQLPSDFTLEMLCEQSRNVKASKRALYKDFWGWCKYHEHDAEAEKAACMTKATILRDVLERSEAASD